MVVNVYEYTNTISTIHGYYGSIVDDGIGICTQTKTMTDQSLGSRLRRQDPSKPSTKPTQKGIKQLNKNAIELWVSELLLLNRSCFELLWTWIDPREVLPKQDPTCAKLQTVGAVRLQTLIVVSFIPNFYLLAKWSYHLKNTMICIYTKFQGETLDWSVFDEAWSWNKADHQLGQLIKPQLFL